MFWLRQFVGLSKENQEDWLKAIQSVNNFDEEIRRILESFNTSTKYN